MGSNALQYKQNGGITAMAIQSNTGSVNYLQMGNARTGFGPNLAAAGSDTNIDLTLTPKNTGIVKVVGSASVAANLSVTGPVNSAGGFKSGSAVGVSCAAGTVSLSTMVVTNGIITHC